MSTELGELRREWQEPAGVAGAVIAVAAAGGWATSPAIASRWYQSLDKPAWQPPGAVFGPVWSVLYALFAASVIGMRRRTPREERRQLYVLFGSNLALNLAWTLIFFRGRSPLAAGVEIIVLEGTCVALIVRAWPLSRLASLALVPYAVWVAFATALTWAIFLRNRRAGRPSARTRRPSGSALTRTARRASIGEREPRPRLPGRRARHARRSRR